MATEYKLSYTATDINERLGKINQLSDDVADLQNDINVVQDNINQLTNNKQNVIIGSAGQIVGFDADGNAIAQDFTPSVQPDWNQNDENAIDYVKNRTHWVEPILETIIEEQQFYIDPSEYRLKNSVIEMVVGKKYIVTIDDVIYECTAWEDTNINETAIGDGTLLGSDHVEDVPFCIHLRLYLDEYHWYIDYKNADRTYTVKVEAESDEPIYHQLDPRFIPNTMPEVTTSDNGKFLRVVDGTWAAATVPNAEEASF